MKHYGTTVLGNLFRFWMGLRGKIAEPKLVDDEPSLRSELLSAHQMRQHGRSLAGLHRLSSGYAVERLLPRLADNEQILYKVRSLLTDAVRAKRRITPAGEWLLDNFYLIEEQIRTAKRHLPKGYSRGLPHLEKGPSTGLPRVYDIALEIISHGDGRVDPESLSNFVEAYQTGAVLKLGELWAIPIMLRLALIENLRRVATRIAADRIDRNHADHWADEMAQTAEKDPKSLILVIADMARSKPPMVSAFVAELTRRLQGQGASLALPLNWIEQHLSESNLTIEQLVQSENQQQAADQLSISNSIGSLRFLGAMDWRKFVEAMSAVDVTLHEDPAQVYGEMDFATRDLYRHAIEKIARNSPLTEDQVAREAVRLAGQGAAEKGSDDRSAHVGFYLIGKGLTELEGLAGERFSVAEVFQKTVRRYPLSFYLGMIGLVTAALTGGLLAKAHAAGLYGFLLWLAGILSFLCLSQLAISLVNWFTTQFITPHALPRMDFSKGIPSESRALVVVPTMLTGAQGIERLIDGLEVRFLANRDESLCFGLLTDFVDAAEERLPEDELLLQTARQGIEGLNKKYRNSKGDLFFLFHRPRLWNPYDRIWMGYERKRGKLAALNSLLRASSKEDFSLIVGDTEALSKVRYVITLDTDTQLPRDSAWQLVGAMAHPLNRPQYDESKQRISEGYGILQPRVAVSLPGTNRSRYARMWGSDPGIDPYTRIVSDVYQDLFGEGSFIGKGIYDVDAFEQVLNGRFPENRILSHDLIEGCYARSGLMSDVQLYEDYPSRYGADVSRRYRWIRGDWQLLRWILPFVPGATARLQRNPLSALSQWKIFDNFRRSLVPFALTALLLLGWTTLPYPWLWTLSVIGIVLIPSLITSILDLLQKPQDALLNRHISVSVRLSGRSFVSNVFTLFCLPYEAYFSMDAIIRTLWRMLVTGKRLLEWNPSGDADRKSRADVTGSYLTMWISPILAVTASVYLVFSRPASLSIALPILGFWFFCPFVSWWLGLPLTRHEARLTGDQVMFLKKMARKTWGYFESFVGPEDHWLPPDNYQEGPVSMVAHRTSPTNMGLALLANLTAYDFGYLSAGQLVERTSKALDTMDAMERYRGHFYNWYDTRTLTPLLPTYISTVDSGNLAADLLILRLGLAALPDEKIVGDRIFAGLNDALEVLTDVAGAEPMVALTNLQAEMESVLSSQSTTLSSVRQGLVRLAACALEALHGFEADPESQMSCWARAMSDQCGAALNELTLLAPWTALSISPEARQSVPSLDAILTLRQLADLDKRLPPGLIAGQSEPDVTDGQRKELDDLKGLITGASLFARARISRIETMTRHCGELASMEYDFLYDEPRHLMAIGYNVSEHRCDTSYYDLLASEARLCTFIAIAQGQLPQESWFALGRLLTTASGEPILLSWSGSMFEYLMPLLVMPTYEGTLLDETYKAAVTEQIKYGKTRGVPWGISESGYNVIDAHLNYQYSAFGVPGIGLRRGLAGDLVVAPYASALALMVAPEEACLNLEKLASFGFEGKYGFYEAIDYTPTHLPRGQSSAVIRSFMAHHQGMSFLSFAYLLLDRPMQRRFESDPMFQATTLLLQERVPKATAFYSHTAGLSDAHSTAHEVDQMPVRVYTSPDTPIPEAQLLSNGRYHVMITNAGGGYSRWKDIAVTRWREDGTCDNWGFFCYIRDLANGSFFSTAYQPTLKETKQYEAIFSEGRAEFRRRDQSFDTHAEIAVSPEDDIELRRVTITNRAQTRRTLDVTSYAEVVLASPAADALHPVFSNLFVQTEIIHHRQAILCTRRPRSSSEQEPWMFHLMAVHGAEAGGVSYETDRTRFIGRGNTTANPAAMSSTSVLSGGEGPVLDPVVAIRHQISLDPDQSTVIDIVTGVADTRNLCMGLVEKYHDKHLADRVFDMAWTHSQVFLRQINASESDAQLYARLASSIIYANSSLRIDTATLLKNLRGQSGLWGYSISGDLPIVLLRIQDPANLDLVRQLVQAHAYWRLKGLPVDLVIWNEDHAGYRQVLQDQIMALISAGGETNVTDRPGGIFVRPGDQISNEDRVLLQAVARVILTDLRGTLTEQINRRALNETTIPSLMPTRTHRPESTAVAALPREDLVFGNGLGGFTRDGREYVISTARGQVTPAPWVNVLANGSFGTVVSESNAGYTWSENAHEFRLTPWYNDPVTDVCGEAFYVRDEERGHFWSPMPLPSRGATPYVTRHGFGYSVFEHTERGIRTEAWIYVALDAPVKFTVLKVFNQSGRARRLSATGYVEWVLGDVRPKSVMHVITEVDPQSGALFARNPYNSEFTNRISFFDVDDSSRTISGDRVEFLGRNGTSAHPAAMDRSRLSGRVGAALDPCGAIQVAFELAQGEEREFVFMLGAGRDVDDAANIVMRFRGSVAAREELEAVWRYWNRTLGAVRVETPDPSINFLANGWLIYQTLACRFWGRSGYYQSGGAFGFRDQLQDAMALVHAEPQLMRQHLLLCAGRQFPEGDVQHWWHPPSGRGVRTHCSDDFLWLPLATCRYVFNTGDTGILDEPVRFIKGRLVNAEEDSYYDLPSRSEETAPLYDHCVRAILRGLRFGEHGLPLIGSGDWNDGMNMVGKDGKGESVWLAFFLYEVLTRFVGVAHLRDDVPFAQRCEREAEKLKRNIGKHGWDGEWYLRAYFDDGTPLGSSHNPECRIDSIAQSWSVLSGAADVKRSHMAMDAVDKYLVDRDHTLVQLLNPPFDKSDLDPGYIKGYLPGIRENGGQYTHAAIWAAMAFASLGDGKRAWELLTIMNPVHHGRSVDEIGTYKVEPYVVAADVYATAPHIGRGGWTWYTGSAAWMYRLIVESLLGLRLEVDKLHVEPCLPADWEGFTVDYRYRQTVYHIKVTRRPAGGDSASIIVDGVAQEDGTISLIDDHVDHSVEVRCKTLPPATA
ncbi:MAG TPA: glucoamylase family protein [Syntrophorhabdaceae bacterium]|nr:glucoamylase family protein [Syntrophorhabdaceae bacterium]